MVDDLRAALKRLEVTSKRLADARETVTGLEPVQVADLRTAKAAGATEAQLVEASGLSRVTVWKRLKPEPKQ